MKIQRTLSPAAAPLNGMDLWCGLRSLFQGPRVLQGLTTEFQNYYGARYVFWLDSGKAALTLLLLGLKHLSSRRKVVIPAYTCFSVPSALVKAGMEVALCDVDPATLDFDPIALEKCLQDDVLAVVPTHLWGYCADVEQVKRYARAHQIYVIEDVAQGFGGMRDGRPLGTMGDVAFLSFGRGKNITCGSGGVILAYSNEIGRAIEWEYRKLREVPLAQAIENWMEVVATQILLHPALYWLPAGLPFLKLGETKFYRDFPIHRMDRIRAGLLLTWKRRLSRSTDTRRERALQLVNALARIPTSSVQTASSCHPAYLRYPVVMNNGEEKNKLCALAKAQGLGISPCYPAPIKEIPELASELSSVQAPGASIVAERLVTLPTHQYVTPRDIENIQLLLEKIASGTHAADSQVATREPRTVSPICNVQADIEKGGKDSGQARPAARSCGELLC